MTTRLTYCLIRDLRCVGAALLAVIVLGLSGCAAIAPPGMPSGAAYEAAIADAAVASPARSRH